MAPKDERHYADQSDNALVKTAQFGDIDEVGAVVAPLLLKALRKCDPSTVSSARAVLMRIDIGELRS